MQLAHSQTVHGSRYGSTRKQNPRVSHYGNSRIRGAVEAAPKSANDLARGRGTATLALWPDHLGRRRHSQGKVQSVFPQTTHHMDLQNRLFLLLLTHPCRLHQTLR